MGGRLRTWVCLCAVGDSNVDLWVELGDGRLLSIESDGEVCVDSDPTTVRSVLRDLEGDAAREGRWRLL